MAGSALRSRELEEPSVPEALVAPALAGLHRVTPPEVAPE